MEFSQEEELIQANHHFNEFIRLATYTDDIMYALDNLFTSFDNIQLLVEICGDSLFKIFKMLFCPRMSHIQITEVKSMRNILLPHRIFNLLFSIAQHKVGRELLLKNGILEKAFVVDNEGWYITYGIDSLLLLRLGVSVHYKYYKEISSGITHFINHYVKPGSSASESVVETMSVIVKLLDEARLAQDPFHYYSKLKLAVNNVVFHRFETLVEKSDPIFTRFVCHLVPTLINLDRFRPVKTQIELVKPQVNLLFKQVSPCDPSGDIFANVLYILGDRRLLVIASRKRYHCIQ